MNNTNGKPRTALQDKLFSVIFGTDTPAGRNFDLLLITAILISVGALLLDTVEAVNQRIGPQLLALEWFFTVLFTVEYLTRLYCSPNKRAYAGSFYGVVDLLAILPSYLALLFPATHYLLIIRLLRVLRIFRVLKLMRYLREANVLVRSLYAARRKILVFLSSLITLITLFGSVMYLVEGPENGFTSLPRSIYWAIVTITTVGYGDITPQTALGQGIAALAMITAYAVIAIPTGIISAELIHEVQRDRSLRRCNHCDRSGHDTDANYCKFCSAQLSD